MRAFLTVLAVFFVLGAPGASAQGPSCDPAGCEGSHQSHFLGEANEVWTFTPPPGFDPDHDDGKCHADRTTEECVFIGKLEVVNNTGADRNVVTDYGVSGSLPSGHSITFTNVVIESGCGDTPAKNYRTETLGGVWTSSYQFICSPCWADIE